MIRDDSRAPFDEWDEDEGHEGADARARAGGWSDLFRKAAATGLGALFMTEAGIRGAVKEFKLPKDAVEFLVEQAERSKGEILRIVGEEMRRFFRSPAFRREVLDFLSEMTIEIDAKVRLKPGAMHVKVDSVEVESKSHGKKKAPKRDVDPHA